MGARKKSIDDVSTVNLVAPTLSPDGVVVFVLTGNAKGKALRIPGAIGEPVRIGKSSSNDLVLPDATVSRQHLTMMRTPQGLQVRDLDSMNGVYVGGARINEAIVEPGTLLRAGDIELLIGVELDNVTIPPSPHERFGMAVGTGIEMRRVFGVLERIAPTSASVLLTGETGTGKDALARSIHMNSPRADGPFEVVDCGAVTGSLIESELFGHERGAFTGAVATRTGAFERAAGGTLFLDEVGELAPELQPKLLRVLEAREFRRVGGNKTLTSDVRIVAATTRNLSREQKSGGFREDLYFRLAVVTVKVPPLRARTQDVALLARTLLDGMGSSLTIDPASASALMSYDWPGNVRELRNVIERGVHMSSALGSRVLVLEGFPPADPGEPDGAPLMAFDEMSSYGELRARVEATFERQFVSWLLAKHDGNVAAAARAARMDRNHLTDLARRHGVDRRRRS